jgi:cytochrome b561
MRLYTMHKGQHLLIFIMFLCLFLIALLMGMAGPRIIATHVEKATALKNPQQNNKSGKDNSKLMHFSIEIILGVLIVSIK